MKTISKIGMVIVSLMVGSSTYAQGLPTVRTGVGAKAELRAETKTDLLQKRADKQENKEERQEKKEEKRNEKKAETKDKRMDKANKFSTQMTRVHQAAVNRLTKLAERINSRINKVEIEKGIKLDASKAKLAEAKLKITSTQTYLNNISAQVAIITATSTPQVALESIRGLFATSRENLKVAHQALVDVISSIKLGLEIKAEATATTTP